MKRSLAVPLVLMGAAALAGCKESPVDTAAFRSVEECSASAIYSPTECAASFAEAQKSHAQLAPAFASKADCEAQFGLEQCEQGSAQNAAASSSSGSFFVPMMMGYLMGSSMNNARMAPQALYRPAGSQNFVNANGVGVASGTGPVRLSGGSPARKPLAKTTTLSRGGFGARSMSSSS